MVGGILNNLSTKCPIDKMFTIFTPVKLIDGEGGWGAFLGVLGEMVI